MDIMRWISVNGSRRPGIRMAACAAAGLSLGLSACVAPFAEMQGARLVGRGNVELTPSYSYIEAGGGSGGTQKVQDDIALQVATGVSDRVDLRARYEVIRFNAEGLDASTHYAVAAGPKFGLVPDRLALYTPVGFGFGGGLSSSETWMFMPTLLFTVPVSPEFEINPSAKGQIWLNNAGADHLLAFNLGVGIGNLAEWAVRPELGVLIDPTDSGHSWHFSVGVSKTIHGGS